MRTRFVALALAVGAVAVVDALQAPTPPPGITRTVLADNATVLVARLGMAPASRETPHTHPFSAVVVQIGAGQVETELDGKKVTERRETGHVQFIPKQVMHAAANVGSGPSIWSLLRSSPTARPRARHPPPSRRQASHAV